MNLAVTSNPVVPIATPSARSANGRLFRNVAIITAGLLVGTVLVWQAVTSHGNPDPTVQGLSHGAVIMDAGILVFREGLEAILVLAALTASLVRTEDGYWKPVTLGAGLSFLASVATWFIVVAIITDINAPALKVQAATGLLAVIVLLVVMNWFFHKVYWTGWITMHNRRKNNLVDATEKTRQRVFMGLVVLGFTSVYREGFEVVLFLQDLRMRYGSHVVLEGTLIGLALTSLVGFLTFAMHYKLPYKRMLVLTGVMLGAVLIVMVGESIQEMQQCGWMSNTNINIHMPDWLNTWFVIYPSVESLAAQVFALVFVIGSYFIARRICSSKSGGPPSGTPEQCIVPDCDNCELSQTHVLPPQ
jgi:high-affinity iron transporter